MTHGGKRPGAGRPQALVDGKRIKALRGQGLTFRQIGERLGVGYSTVQRHLKALKD